VLERDHGYRVPRALAVELSQVVQALTDARGQELTSPEIGALFEAQYFEADGPYVFENAGIERRREGKECAVVARLSVHGERRDLHGIGNGPVEAFVAALRALIGLTVEVVDYAEHAAAPSAAARAVAYVSVRIAGHERYGAGQDEDVVLATFRAIISACNRAQGPSARTQAPATVA
jgi:2-isopropylmalate synthase